MNFTIFLHPKANSFLEKLDKSLQNNIKKKISELKTDPRKAKHLKYSEFWRLRVGDYRVIYEINENEHKIIVLFIGHRKSVYTDFSKLF